MQILLSAGIHKIENMSCAGSEKTSRCQNANRDFGKKMIYIECHDGQMTSSGWYTSHLAHQFDKNTW
jgi:hypothetical protein